MKKFLSEHGFPNPCAKIMKGVNTGGTKTFFLVN